jgi:hypothetical protein
MRAKILDSRPASMTWRAANLKEALGDTKRSKVPKLQIPPERSRVILFTEGVNGTSKRCNF